MLLSASGKNMGFHVGPSNGHASWIGPLAKFDKNYGVGSSASGAAHEIASLPHAHYLSLGLHAALRKTALGGPAVLAIFQGTLGHWFSVFISLQCSPSGSWAVLIGLGWLLGGSGADPSGSWVLPGGPGCVPRWKLDPRNGERPETR